MRATCATICCMRGRQLLVVANGSIAGRLRMLEGRGRAFVIDNAWLESAIDVLSAGSAALNEIRPLNKNAAFGDA